MHYLGSDIRGKTPEQLAYGKKADAEIVGSYDAIRWVPEAEVIPPGIDLAAIAPAPPSERKRPLIVHAPSSRRRKGSEHVIAAVDGLDADLELVEGLHHDEAFERYRAADIVVDQLNAGWYGLFAIEAMALGKPVVTFLHDEAVRRTEEAFGTRTRADRLRGRRDAARDPPAARLGRERGGARYRRRASRAYVGARATTSRRVDRPPARDSTLVSNDLAPRVQMRRLGKHSAVYGLGGIVSRVIAVFLLPLYTRYLYREDRAPSGPSSLSRPCSSRSSRFGISSAFFRFYFDSKDAAHRLLVVRTSFWFTMASATFGLVAGVLLAQPIADSTRARDDANLVRAGVRGDLGADELRAADVAVPRRGAVDGVRVRQPREHRGHDRRDARSSSSSGSKGALGVIVGNFAGTLTVYLALLAVHRSQLGLQFSRALLREMNRFGIPLVPAALALIVVNFSDRFFLVHLASLEEVGLYEIGVRIASAMVLLLTAFRMAWPAFAYSIEDDGEAQANVRVRPHLSRRHRLLARAWAGLLAPWLVRLLTQPDFYAGERVVAPLAFAPVRTPRTS